MTTPPPVPPAGTPGSPAPSNPDPGQWPSANWQTATPLQPEPKKGSVFTSKPAIGVAALLIGLAIGTSTARGGAVTAGSPAPAPTVTVTATVAPQPTEEPSPTPTEAESKPATPAKKNYKKLSSRQFKLMVKDPDAYIGKNYTIFGEVTQFDAATGTDTFRADTGPKKLRITYGFVDYSQNSFLSGSESKLKKLVEGDCFKAKVTVLGSYSYDTQSGGNTTVPLFQVNSVSVYGSTD